MRQPLWKDVYLTNSQKVRNSVMLSKAGIQNYLKILNSRLRGNDAKGRIKTFYDTIIWYKRRLSKNPKLAVFILVTT